jgi:hypothetical protein
MAVPPIKKPKPPTVGRIQLPALPLELKDLERITTAIPWPRGLVFNDFDELVVLARGGVGMGPVRGDQGGALFVVDLISEPAQNTPTPTSEVARSSKPLTDPAKSKNGER